jgi:hypothetical protein
MLLSACASLDLIHDPETGLITRSEVPGFMKSVRCEMATFYQANASRQKVYTENMAAADQWTKKATANPRERAVDLQRAADFRKTAILEGKNFPVSPALFGGVFLDLKVLDTLGIGAADSTLANRSGRDATHTVTWTGSPTLNTQNTYEMNFSFLIDQRSGLSRTGHDDSFRCYSADLPPDVTILDLAADKPAGAAQFTRILVNATTPLAVWLIQNGDQAWDNFHAVHQDAEGGALIPVQINYAFTVQITGGLDVRYSLVSPIWNPAQIGAQASSVQSSLMSIYINGDDANLAGGAKLGQAVNGAAKAGGVAPGVPNVNEGDIGRKKQEADRQVAVLEAKLKEIKDKPKTPGAAETAGPTQADIETQLEAWRSIQQSLRQAPAVVRAPVGGVSAGNKRGYLNAPVGIAPPP